VLPALVALLASNVVSSSPLLGETLRLRAGSTALRDGPKSSRTQSMPRVLVINLDKDAARWATTSRELVAQRVPRVERVSGVYGKALTPAELRQNVTALGRIFATPGMIGCFLSHRRCWQRTMELPNGGSALVLEDDVQLASDFVPRLREALGELEAATGGDWDVLLVGALGCVHPAGHYGLNRINAFFAGGGRRPKWVSPHVAVPRRPFGTHAYVVSRRGAEKLHAKLTKASYHIDGVAWGIQDLDLYIVHPMLAHQAFTAPSTIGGVVQGIETRIPRVVVDEYTGVTLNWAFNEPVIRVWRWTWTIGRCLGAIVVGFLASAVTKNRVLLATHSSLTFSAFVLMRVMNRGRT